MRFGEWDRFVLDRAHPRKRTLNDDVAFARHDDALFRYDEAVARATTPFASGVAVAAAGNPTVMGRGNGNDKNEASNHQHEPCKASEHESVPFVIPARPLFK